MMGSLLYVLALVSFLLAAFNVPAKGVNFTALVMPQVLLRFL